MARQRSSTGLKNRSSSPLIILCKHRWTGSQRRIRLRNSSSRSIGRQLACRCRDRVAVWVCDHVPPQPQSPGKSPRVLQVSLPPRYRTKARVYVIVSDDGFPFSLRSICLHSQLLGAAFQELVVCKTLHKASSSLFLFGLFAGFIFSSPRSR